MQKHLIVVLLLLSGCVTENTPLGFSQGRWRDYHDLSAGAVKMSLKDNPAPENIKDRFADCSATWLGQFIHPDEQTRLDAYARGDIDLSVGELKQLDQNIAGRTPLKTEMTSDDLWVLKDVCPADIPAFQTYRLPRA